MRFHATILELRRAMMDQECNELYDPDRVQLPLPYRYFLRGIYYWHGDIQSPCGERFRNSHRSFVPRRGKQIPFEEDLRHMALDIDTAESYWKLACGNAFECNAVNWLLHRYCSGWWPVKPFEIDWASETDRQCIDRIAGKSFLTRWIVNSKLNEADHASPHGEELSDPDVNITLSLLDRYRNGHNHAAVDREKVRTYSRLRSSPWQVAGTAMYHDRPSRRSIRSNHVRDELIALSRTPFTLEWQVQTIPEDAQGTAIFNVAS